MKKLKILISILAGFFLGCCASVLVYFITRGMPDWREFIKEECIPTALIVITSVGTICVSALPIVKAVNYALDRFNKATKDVNDTAESGRLASDEIKAYKESIEQFMKQFAELHEDVSTLKAMCKKAFVNSTELVQKGVAKEIAKIGGVENENAKTNEA